MSGNLYVITGANTGLGLQAALTLAKQGETVVIGARDTGRLASSVEQVNAAGASAGGHAAAIQLDLADLSNVQAFVRELLEKYPGQKLQGLILNAGINVKSFGWSKDGVERTFATNHLGHFYLTELLLPHLAPDARIVVTSSGTHDPAVKAPLPEPKWGHPSEVAMLKSDHGGQPPKGYDGGLAYTRSKLCNILFTYHLARQLKQKGSAVTVTAYDPGFCPDTDLSRDMPGIVRCVFYAIVPWYMWMARSPQRPSTAAASGAFLARLAYDPEFAGVTGKYFSITKEEPSSPASYDEGKQAALWEYSEQLLEKLLSAAEGAGAEASGAVGAEAAAA